jgi:hypothetical protein
MLEGTCIAGKRLNSDFTFLRRSDSRNLRFFERSGGMRVGSCVSFSI